jgi:histidinol dehydrogenase
MKHLNTSAPDFEAAFQSLLAGRSEAAGSAGDAVAAIIADVRANGDAALLAYTARYDRLTLTAPQLRVTEAEISAATASIPADLAQALDHAATRIERFHRAQLPRNLTLEDPEGLTLGMRWAPLDAVGLYVPGGKAAYPSSVLMNAIPAREAGVSRIAMCVPSPDGTLAPLVLAAARRAGVAEIYRVGGAQAVAALAYGTATIAPVDRIVGPGNAYVAAAKRQVFGTVGIDSIAGPSEVVIIADGGQDPARIAMDLLAQAEHDEAAQAILLTPSEPLARAAAEAVTAALATLPRAAIAGASWQAHGAIIVTRDEAEATALANRLAPEHLQIMTAQPRALFEQIRHAGAVFLGPDCPEALGDYIAGPNHVLPTGRSARFASGLSVFDFLKRTTWIDAKARGLAAIGPDAVLLAKAEGLTAHASSIAMRLKAE